LEELPDPVSPFGVLVVPQAGGLSTAEVYATADRLGSVRDSYFLKQRHHALRGALELGAGVPADSCLLHNDLQAASVELCPAIKQALEHARDAGADATFVSGSGPTVVGLFARANGLARAERAAAGLEGRVPPPLVGEPVGAESACVRRLGT
jgi:4-diphosphocytidyl-2C-methyl-D-erythritol kinase